MQIKSGAVTSFLQAVTRPVLLFLAFLICLFIPRQVHRWVLCAERETADLVALARHLRTLPGQSIIVVVAQPQQPSLVPSEITVVRAASWRGFWATARARYLCLVGVSRPTNEYAAFGAVLAQIDATITTAKFRAAAPKQWPLAVQRVLRFCKPEVTLYTVSSYVHAQQVRQYTKVLPGQVVVTGAPRLDFVDTLTASKRREQLLAAAGIPETAAQLVLCRVPNAALANFAASLLEHESSFSDNNICVLIWPEHPELAAPQRSGVSVRVVDPPDCFNPAWYAEFALVVTAQHEFAADAGVVATPVLWYDAGSAVIPPQLNAAATNTATLVADILAAVTVPMRALTLRRAATQYAKRLHEAPDGAACERTVAALTALDAKQPRSCEVLLCHSGRQQNLDLEMLADYLHTAAPQLRQIWAVTDERAAVPVGAATALYGEPGWHKLQRSAALVLSGSTEVSELLRPVRRQQLIAVSQQLVVAGEVMEAPEFGVVRARFDALRPALVAATQHPTGVNPIVQRVAKTELGLLSGNPVLFDLRCYGEAEQSAVSAGQGQLIRPVADPRHLQKSLLQQLYAADGIVVDALGELLFAALLLRLPVAMDVAAPAEIAALIPVPALVTDAEIEALLRGDSAPANWWQEHDVSAVLRQHFASTLEELTPGSCCKKIIAVTSPKYSTSL